MTAAISASAMSSGKRAIVPSGAWTSILSFASFQVARRGVVDADTRGRRLPALLGSNRANRILDDTHFPLQLLHGGRVGLRALGDIQQGERCPTSFIGR